VLAPSSSNHEAIDGATAVEAAALTPFDLILMDIRIRASMA